MYKQHITHQTLFEKGDKREEDEWKYNGQGEVVESTLHSYMYGIIIMKSPHIINIYKFKNKNLKMNIKYKESK
jgi:hypothetical protein